ncbi:hypothetical protein CHU98_g7043 [Xylaria longipes]|nr:hypothetical protein CHU98_g7043 [Xylaria longipes]
MSEATEAVPSATMTDGASLEDPFESPGAPGEESTELSQKQILDFVAQIATDNNEDALAFTARLEQQLMKKSTSSQQLSLQHAKRPREYNVKNLGTDTLDYLQRAHLSYRVAFGLYLNQDPILAIIKKIFNDFPGSQDVKENAERVAWERLRNNCSSWKLKTIKRLEDHIKYLCTKDKVFAGCKDISTLHSFLKNKFDPDNWSEIMEPWKKTVNIRGSKPSVHRWCKNLGARIKLSLDWQNMPAADRPAEAVWDKDAIGLRFDALTRADAIRSIRPPKADIVMVPPQRTGRAAKRVKRQVAVVDVVTDPDIYVDSE